MASLPDVYLRSTYLLQALQIRVKPVSPLTLVGGPLSLATPRHSRAPFPSLPKLMPGYKTFRAYIRRSQLLYSSLPDSLSNALFEYGLRSPILRFCETFDRDGGKYPSHCQHQRL